MKFLTKERIGELVRFFATGGVSTLVDYGVMVLLKEGLGANYLIASGFGFAVAVVVNYLMCVKWVFVGAESGGAQVKLVFLLTSLIGLGLNQLLMWALVDGLGLHYMLSKLGTTGVVMIYNYFAKRWALVR